MKIKKTLSVAAAVLLIVNSFSCIPAEKKVNALPEDGAKYEFEDGKLDNCKVSYTPPLPHTGKGREIYNERIHPFTM